MLLLLLQEQVHVLLLDDKRQRKARNVKRQFLGIVHAQHIDLLDNLVNRPLEFTHTRLIVRIRLDNVGQHLLGHGHPLGQAHLLERRRQQVLFRNRHLLLQVVALELNHHETVQQHPVNLGNVIRRKHKHDLGQVNRHTRQVLVLEPLVRRRVRQVNQHVLDLLALGRRADLVHLVKEEDRRHGLGRNEGIHNLAAVRRLVDELVSRIGGCIGITAQANELKGPAERLGNAILDDTRLANAGRADEEERHALSVGIGNLGRNVLENLELCVLLAVNGLVQGLEGPLHKGSTGLGPVSHLDGEFLVHAKRHRHNLVEPVAHLKVLAARGLQILKGIVLGQDERLRLGRNLERQNAQHEMDPRIRHGGALLEGRQEFRLLFCR